MHRYATLCIRSSSAYHGLLTRQTSSFFLRPQKHIPVVVSRCWTTATCPTRNVVYGSLFHRSPLLFTMHSLILHHHPRRRSLSVFYVHVGVCSAIYVFSVSLFVFPYFLLLPGRFPFLYPSSSPNRTSKLVRSSTDTLV